jgi:predicted dehydrogenase
MRVAIVGCGLIGHKRAEVIRRSSSDVLALAVDSDLARAKDVAQGLACRCASDWQAAIAASDVDAVVVATPNKLLAPITVASLLAGKHVLCEKPPGRSLGEAQQMADAARKAGRVLKIGFNHRHHPAVYQAHEMIRQGVVGPLMFLRAVYGHGGRPGYDQEWRADPDLAGGGELLDQGVHIVDLSRWFLGEFTEVYARTSTYYWDLGFYPSQPSAEGSLPRAQLEDNAFALLSTDDGKVAQFHTSWTQWKNRFSFEVFGRDGYARVEGLGGSYGTETLTLGRRKAGSGPPDEERFEFPGADLSWQSEWEEFAVAIREGRQPMASGEDAVETMRVTQALYVSAAMGQPVHIAELRKAGLSGSASP